MALHRTGKRPDWAGIAQANRNAWQRLAARTNGIVTLSNVVTIIGYTIVVVGLKAIVDNHLVTGGILLAIGRLLDIADGIIAEATSTKSPVGELLDASIDKVGTVLTIIVLLITGIAPWWLLAALLLPQFIIPVISLRRVRDNQPLHPSRMGKNSMFIAWITLLGMVFVAAADNPVYLVVPLYATAASAIVMSCWAAVRYARGKY